jgi:hypothetical protein
MLINQNIENAARVAMGPLALEEPTIKVPRSGSATMLRIATACILLIAVVVAAVAIFS